MKRASSSRVAVVALALALALPWLLEDQGYAIRVVTLVLLFAAMAQSWNIVGGLANQISLGHAAFFGLGAYTSTLLLIHWGISPWLGLFASAAVAAIAGALLSLPTMRLRGHYFALATLAFGEVLRAVANTWASVTGGPVGLSLPFAQGVSLMQFASSIPYYYLMLAAALLASAVFAWISRSRLGYRLRAVKANPQAAEVIGVDTVKTRILAAVISAALMGVCGTLYAQFIYFFDPDTVFSLAGISIRVALICIIGGVGTVAGPLVGALLIIPVEELLNNWLSAQAAGASQLAFGVMLVAVILVEPRGLSALWRRVRQGWKGGAHG